MDRYLITHSLLSAWQYALREDPYEDATTERDRYAEFLDVLNRVPTPTTEAMQNGIDFEDLVTRIANGTEASGDRIHNWYGAASRIAETVRGGQFQLKAKKETVVFGTHFLLHGRLDALRAGSIYDIKFSRSYERGKFFGSTQHPMYLELIPEACDFSYLISNGTDVWTETYAREDTPSIFPVIADFSDWINCNGLWQTYAEKWKAK